MLKQSDKPGPICYKQSCFCYPDIQGCFKQHLECKMLSASQQIQSVELDQEPVPLKN